LFFIDKSSTIFNSFLKKKLIAYNGKELKELLIERGHIGRKVGEFVFTRKMGQIHKKKIKKNLRKKK
jgi:ribosomal protein S19